MARLLPTLVVFALLGSTAAAFAITEGLKLEKSPITRTAVDKVIAPGSNTSSRASIGFFLRKPDRLTVVIVDRHDNVVRTLARSMPARRGTQQFTWDGRDDEHLLVPDGTYRPRVHLAHEHRTILLPNPIRMDATPPLIKLVSVAPRVFSPDGDGRRDFPRIQYRTSEKARAVVYVDGDRRATVRRYARAGKFDWRGRAVRRLPAGAYRITLRAIDLAGNVGRPSRTITVFVRYIDLRPHVLQVKTGTRFGVRVLTDAKRYSVHLKGLHVLRSGLHVLRSGRVLFLHAPAPGRYVLRVAANGHVARAIVLVSR